MIVKDKIRIEKQEDNVKTIPMVFPITKNKEWDGNLLNTDPSKEYSYNQIHQFFSLDSLTFDSTTTINQQDEENFIERFFTEEKYASGFGLVHRSDISLRTTFDGKIESGYEAKLQLIDFKYQLSIENKFHSIPIRNIICR